MKKVLAKFFDERMNEKWTKNVSSIDSLNFRMESKKYNCVSDVSKDNLTFKSSLQLRNSVFGRSPRHSLACI